MLSYQHTKSLLAPVPVINARPIASSATGYFFMTVTVMRFGRVRGTRGSVHTEGFYKVTQETPRTVHWTRERIEQTIRSEHPEYLQPPWKLISATILELTEAQATGFIERDAKHYEVDCDGVDVSVFPLA